MAKGHSGKTETWWQRVKRGTREALGKHGGLAGVAEPPTERRGTRRMVVPELPPREENPDEERFVAKMMGNIEEGKGFFLEYAPRSSWRTSFESLSFVVPGSERTAHDDLKRRLSETGDRVTRLIRESVGNMTAGIDIQVRIKERLRVAKDEYARIVFRCLKFGETIKRLEQQADAKRAAEAVSGDKILPRERLPEMGGSPQVPLRKIESPVEVFRKHITDERERAETLRAYQTLPPQIKDNRNLNEVVMKLFIHENGKVRLNARTISPTDWVNISTLMAEEFKGLDQTAFHEDRIISAVGKFSRFVFSWDIVSNLPKSVINSRGVFGKVASLFMLDKKGLSTVLSKLDPSDWDRVARTLRLQPSASALNLVVTIYAGKQGIDVGRLGRTG